VFTSHPSTLKMLAELHRDELLRAAAVDRLAMQARTGRRNPTAATIVRPLLALVALTRRPVRAPAYQP
jgi:hypothetical protein